MSDITDVAALEACIGKTPGPMHLKVIDHLDAGAMQWLAASPLMFVGFGSTSGIDVSLAGGAAGFVDVLDPRRIRLPKASLDHPDAAVERQGFGALCLVPTIGETLRLNGRVRAVHSDAVEIDVDECYVHCAKALIRSDFWRATPSADTSADVADFLAASRLVALASVDAQGRADLSPKGDPAGKMIRFAEDGVWFADRPGNRRADSFRNILTQPRVALAVLTPGAPQVALVSGAARLTTDDAARAGFSVREKVPHLAIAVAEPRIALYRSGALARAGLWPAKPPAVALDPAAVLVGHVKLSKERGLSARIARAAVSIPGLMQKGLDRDYQTNLY